MCSLEVLDFGVLEGFQKAFKKHIFVGFFHGLTGCSSRSTGRQTAITGEVLCLGTCAEGALCFSQDAWLRGVGGVEARKKQIRGSKTERIN